MLKKRFFIVLMSVVLFQVASSNAGMVEVGFENEQYNSDYDASDVFMPYISTQFSPMDDSPLSLSMKYMYQDQYGKSNATTPNDRFKTKRDRLEMYAKGYQWKRDNFTFAPEVGYRYEQWKINDENKNRQDKRKLELRFFPNMNYKITNNTSVYLSGFVAPVFMETKQEARKSSSYVKGELGTNKYYGDYYHELQLLGLKHSLPNKDSVWTSIYSEVKYQEHVSEYNRWQLRLGYNWSAMPELAINPFIRQDLYFKEKNLESGTANNGNKRRKNETRIGSTWSYTLDSTLSVLGELYWQTATIQDYKGTYKSDKDRMFYKLGIRKTF